MKPKIRTSLSWTPDLIEKEVFTLPSQTQADMTLSLKELLEKHTRGLEIPTFTGGHMDYEENIMFVPDPLSMDLTDYPEYLSSNQLQIEELREKIKSMAPKEPKEKSPKDSSPKQPGDAGAPNEGEAS